MGESLVPGPTVDTPGVSGYYAGRDFNWANTTVSIRYPNVAVAGQPVRVWVCLSLGVGTHQSGAGIAYTQLNLVSASASSVSVDTGSVTAPLDDEYPNGSSRNPGAEPCIAQDIVAPAAGTNVAAVVPGISLRGRTICVGCGTAAFDYSDITGSYGTGPAKDLAFNFPRLIPDSAQDDFIVVASSGPTIYNPLPNDYDPLHLNNGSTTLMITSVTEADGNATCTVDSTLTVSITPLNGATSGVCEYFYTSNEINSYDLTKTIGSAKIYWNTIPEPQPIAGADYATVDAWYGALNVPASTGADVDTTINLLANDSDPLGGTLSVINPPTASAQGGIVSVDAAGVATYTPAEGFCGTDSFQYTLQAAAPPVGVSTREATGTVNIEVVCNTAPIAIDDSANVTQAGTVTGTVRANDLDFQDPTASLTYTVVTAPTHGTLTLNADGSYTYVHDGTTTPTTDTFSYQVCDNHATMGSTNPATLPLCSTATATIYITLAPQAYPVAVADAATVDSYYSADGQAATSIDVDVAANDSDADGNLDPTSVTILSGPSATQGTLVNNSDGTLTFSPADGYAGLVTVVYQICDDPTAATPVGTTPLCTSSVLLITVAGNTAPVAIDDSASVAQDSSGNVINLTYNDFDPNGDGVVISMVDATSANGGTVVDNGDGTVTYTPAAGYSGPDTFTYQVCDTHTAVADSTAVMTGDPWVRCVTATATIDVIITPNVAPVAEDDTLNTAYNTVGIVDLLNNDTDLEDGVPTVQSVEAVSAAGGSVVLNADGTATYTPKAGFCGIDSFDYTVADSLGLTDTATVQVLVGCQNDDTDGDGIPDWVEVIMCGTTTCGDVTTDTDGDGIPDWVEIMMCGTATCADPAAGTDTDGDGIPDWVEIIVCGTTTCADGTEDTDGDGIPDWVEVMMCGTTTCATTDTDTDGDGIPDWIEIIMCGTTSCASPDTDTDGDGIPDWIEVIMCGTATCANANTDTDGDGVPDYIEIAICGTATCLDKSTDSDGDGIPDWIEYMICGTATCADGTEDTDGNGVPDWQEIATCGSPGCILDYLKNKPVGSCTNTATFTIPGTFEYDIPNGFRSNTDIRIFMYSDPVLLYSGPLPDTGKITLSIPADTVAGKHKFMVIGVDDITGSVKIDGCYKMGELPKSSVLGATQTNNAAAATGTASPNSKTGSSLTLPLALVAGALLLVGGALMLLRRRREEQ